MPREEIPILLSCEKDLKDNEHNSLHLGGAKICSDISPWILSVHRFSSSYALEIRFSEEICLLTNILAYFRTKWKILFIYNVLYVLVCYSYELVYYWYVLVCYSYALVCYSYVLICTRIMFQSRSLEYVV